MTYSEIIQTWLHQMRPTMVESTGKTIPTTIKYRTLRIVDNCLYIKEEPVLKYKCGLLFFYSFGHYSIKKILYNLYLKDYIVEMESLNDDRIILRLQDYVISFIDDAERFNYIHYDIGIKAYYMDETLFQDCTPKIKYFRILGPFGYNQARKRHFARQCETTSRPQYILNGIWKVNNNDF